MGASIVAQQSVGHRAEPDVSFAVLEALRRNVDTASYAGFDIFLFDREASQLLALSVDEHGRLGKGRKEDVAIAEREQSGDEGESLREYLLQCIMVVLGIDGTNIISCRRNPYRATVVFSDFHGHVDRIGLEHTEAVTVVEAFADSAHGQQPQSLFVIDKHFVDVVFVAIGRRVARLQVGQLPRLRVVDAEPFLLACYPEMVLVVSGYRLHVLSVESPNEMGVGIEHVLISIHHFESLTFRTQPKVAVRVGIDLRDVEVRSLEGEIFFRLVDELLLAMIIEPESVAVGVEQQVAFAVRMDQRHDIIADCRMLKHRRQGHEAA